MTKNSLIPLEETDEEIQHIIAAFRKAGSLSYQDIPIELSRSNYVQSASENGIAIGLDSVESLTCPVKNGNIQLRLYRSQPKNINKPELPIIVYFHGGGWVIGNLDSHDRVCRYLADKTDLPVLAVDYRLAPEHKFPVAVQDCVNALHYLCKQHKSLHIDRNKIIVVGDSAGGNLATILAHQFNEEISGNMIAQVLFYPVTDLTTQQKSYTFIQEGFPLTSTTMHWFIDCYLTGNEDRKNPLLSPLFAPISINKPKTFIMTVGLDPLADEGVAYAYKLAQEGCEVEHYHLPKQMHGIITYTAKIKTSRLMLDNASEFINTCIS